MGRYALIHRAQHQHLFARQIISRHPLVARMARRQRLLQGAINRTPRNVGPSAKRSGARFKTSRPEPNVGSDLSRPEPKVGPDLSRSERSERALSPVRQMVQPPLVEQADGEQQLSAVPGTLPEQPEEEAPTQEGRLPEVPLSLEVPAAT